MKKKTDTSAIDANNTKGETAPIKSKGEVQQSNDERIDQDFPGFPHAPSTEKQIKTTKKGSTKD